MSRRYLLDTHALVQWQTREDLPPGLADFLDEEAWRGVVLVSAVSFWETALLARRGRIRLGNPAVWKDEILTATGVTLVTPDVDDYLASVALPDHHRDPFDRVLIAQARRLRAQLVTRDAAMHDYGVEIFWR